MKYTRERRGNGAPLFARWRACVYRQRVISGRDGNFQNANFYETPVLLTIIIFFPSYCKFCNSFFFFAFGFFRFFSSSLPLRSLRFLFDRIGFTVVKSFRVVEICASTKTTRRTGEKLARDNANSRAHRARTDRSWIVTRVRVFIEKEFDRFESRVRSRSIARLTRNS